MKTKTFTPSPWVACPTTCHPRNPYSVRMDVVTTSGEWNPAFIAGDMLPEDARLIAASPDMLAALQMVADLNSYAPNATKLLAAIEQAKATIEKAIGGAQ